MYVFFCYKIQNGCAQPHFFATFKNLKYSELKVPHFKWKMHTGMFLYICFCLNVSLKLRFSGFEMLFRLACSAAPPFYNVKTCLEEVLHGFPGARTGMYVKLAATIFYRCSV